MPEANLLQSDASMMAGTRELLLMARHRNLIGIARLIETLCGLPFNTSLKLLTTEKGYELLYLIRAIGLPHPHDMQFALMAMPRIGRSHGEYRNAKSLLADLDQGDCQMIFNEIGATFRIRAKSSDLVDSEQSDAFQNAKPAVQPSNFQRQSLPMTPMVNSAGI